MWLLTAFLASGAVSAVPEEDGMFPWLGEQYQRIYKDVLDGDLRDGLGGILPALLRQTPSTEPVWDLLRIAEDAVEEPPAPPQVPFLSSSPAFSAGQHGPDSEPLPDPGTDHPSGAVGTASEEGDAPVPRFSDFEDTTRPVDDLIRHAGEQAGPLPTGGAADLIERLLDPLSTVDLAALDLSLFEQDGAEPAPPPAAGGLAAFDGLGDVVDGRPGADRLAPMATDAHAPTAAPLPRAPLPGGGASGGEAHGQEATPWLTWLQDVASSGGAATMALLGMAALFIPPLYHRLQRHKLLEHPTRARLCDIIRQRPGAHIEELATAAGIARSTAVYHLKLLARHNVVLTMGTRKTVHYYPNNGHAPEAQRARMALVSSLPTRAVAAHVAAHPGSARGDIAARLGISPSTLSWHLGKLFEQGLVEERRNGGAASRLHPGPGLDELLAAWEAAPAPADDAGPDVVPPPADPAPAALQASPLVHVSPPPAGAPRSSNRPSPWSAPPASPARPSAPGAAARAAPVPMAHDPRTAAFAAAREPSPREEVAASGARSHAGGRHDPPRPTVRDASTSQGARVVEPWERRAGGALPAPPPL